MEKLQSLLRAYNQGHPEDNLIAPWNRQFCEDVFPKYWEITYYILQSLDKDNRVIEIGSGLGSVTSILCYLGYNKVVSFEKNALIACKAKHRIKALFNVESIVKVSKYPDGEPHRCDILILVNCAYSDQTKTKPEYLDLLREFYELAGMPRYFILEVIDDSYTEADKAFPLHIRLCETDIRGMFPDSHIKCWETYKYPENEKSKTLYLIEKV